MCDLRLCPRIDIRRFNIEKRGAVVLVTIVVIASLLRIAGIFDDFWLDEIWSYEIAQKLTHFSDVLLLPAAKIDNNHPLNTLWIWLIGEHSNWHVYRLPALAAGIGSVILAVIIAKRRGTIEAIVAAALVGFSYPLIHYSSEARGYSLAIFFALLAFDALERYLARPAGIYAAVFAISCVLGFLSHITFIHIYAGMFAWSVYRLRKVILRLISLHAIPVISFALFYIAFASKLTLGGSPPQPLGQAISESIARLVAFGGSPVVNWIFTIAALVGVIALIVAFAKMRSDLWIFFLVALVISPAIVLARQVLIAEKWQPILPRYFLILLPFAILGVSFLSPRWLARHAACCLFLTLLCFFLISNLWRTVRFLQIGRGHYSDAVAYIFQNTAGPVVNIAVDSPLRSGMPLEFYAHRETSGKTLLLRSLDEFSANPTDPPQWIILSSNIRNSPPPVPLPSYVFDRDFSYFGLSGYCWYVYRFAPNR